jgi:proline iminopeptidase
VDDTRLWVLEMGEGHPIVLLHGGPGLDHTAFRPWMDPLAERFRLIYVDQRSQGRSDRSDPATWTFSRLASDVSALVSSLELESYAVLGHSFGSFVALHHAVEHGTASHYVLIGSVASERWQERVEQNLAALEPAELRERVTASWEREAEAETEDEFREVFRDQLPFHFADVDTDAFRRFHAAADRIRFAPHVLPHLAREGYGRVEVEEQLPSVRSPVLVVTGEHDRVTVPEGGYAIAEAVPEADFVLIRDAGHMAFAEKPKAVHRAIRAFFDRYPVSTDPASVS